MLPATTRNGNRDDSDQRQTHSGQQKAEHGRSNVLTRQLASERWKNDIACA
ncbi:Uncharacterised protein [Vibrio cholerae]|nr:Uncharacterised protein [Vibrio cholerae]